MKDQSYKIKAPPAVVKERKIEGPVIFISMAGPRKNPVPIVQPTLIKDNCNHLNLHLHSLTLTTRNKKIHAVSPHIFKFLFKASRYLDYLFL